jgi:hypothetical protein
MVTNKKMQPQEIGLYRMAKEAKALKEAKKTMIMANAMSISDGMKAHQLMMKK